MSRNRLIQYLVIAAVLILVPLVIDNNYVLHVLVMLGIYSILVLGLEIILGQTGLFSLGHAAFYGMGAYTSALLVMKLGFPFWISFIAAMCVTGFFGALLGFPVLRLRGDYLAIATLGFGEIFRLTLVNWDSLTRGPMGLPGIPRPSFFAQPFTREIYYYLVVIIFIIALWFALQIFNSHLGRAFRAIKDDEDAALFMGINITKYKILAFTIGGIYAGAAGSFYAHYITFISPDTFVYFDSAYLLCMVFLGGAGTIVGPVIGAFFLTIFPEVTRFMVEWRMLLVGALMVLMMIFRPQGILGGKTKLPWYKMNWVAEAMTNEKLNARE
jgi:branched-chain amino acid transport system permease protein